MISNESTVTNKCRILCNPWLAASVGLFIFVCDFITKRLTYLYLPSETLGHGNPYPYGGIAIFKNFLGIEFSLVHATNRGAAWGVMADFQHFLLGVRILLVLVLLAYLFFSKKHPEWRIPMSLIVAGAVGNIIDYFLYGHVVDMFHFVLWGYDYPVFNVADSAIFIGIFWLLIASYFDKSEKASV